MPCITVPLNIFIETGGAHSAAFDFQLRPVGRTAIRSSVDCCLRSKDLVSKHEHGRVNSKFFCKEHRPKPTNGEQSQYRAVPTLSQAKKWINVAQGRNSRFRGRAEDF